MNHARTHDGIPNFLRYESALDADQENGLLRMVRLAEARGWEHAVRELDPAGWEYLVSASRNRYIDLLPLDANTDVLEIGASKGQHTALLAARSRFVDALEVEPLQARLAQLRCQNAGLTNVRIAVGGDDCVLPYDPARFDVVVLNYVFEWCGNRMRDEPFEEGQKRLLKECVRVLRPGGCLFISTKNRYSLRMLIGRRDEHTGMRFGSVLPRWLSRLLKGQKGFQPGQGLLHSYGALRGMLGEAGFRRLDLLWAIPDARYPKEYVAMEPGRIAEARLRYRQQRLDGHAGRLLMGLCPDTLIPWLAPSLVFRAYV